MKVVKIVKVFFCLALTVALASATGCALGKQVGVSSSNPSDLSISRSIKNPPPQQASTIATHTADQTLSSQGHATNNSSTHQKATQASHQPVHATSYKPSAQTLTTLGPNDDFRQLVSNASGIVLVDFYADWCGPCRQQGRILHDMESSASQKNATIIKVNIDQHQQLAREFNVSSLPTLVVIKNNKIIERQSGMADRHQVASLLSH